MKKKLIKSTALGLMILASMSFNTIEANASWKKDSIGWWYETGYKSWATGWEQINNHWYYFYNDGYMAANSWVDDGYYVNNWGVWTQTAKYKRSDVMNDYIATGESGRKYGQAGDEQNGILWNDKINEPCLNCMFYENDSESGVEIGLNTLNVYNYDGEIIDKVLLNNK